MVEIFRLKQGICRQRAAEIHPLRAHLFQHRNNGINLFRAHMAAFARVRVQAANQHVRVIDAKFGAQIVMQNGDDFPQQLGGNRIAYCFKRQVSGHQRHAQRFGRQHHHHFTGLRALFKELGMTGEGDPRIVDNALVHRPGNQRGEFAVQTAITGAGQRFHHIAAVADVEHAWLNRRIESDGKKRQGACALRRSGNGRVIRQKR